MHLRQLSLRLFLDPYNKGVGWWISVKLTFEMIDYMCIGCGIEMRASSYLTLFLSDA